MKNIILCPAYNKALKKFHKLDRARKVAKGNELVRAYKLRNEAYRKLWEMRGLKFRGPYTV